MDLLRRALLVGISALAASCTVRATPPARLTVLAAHAPALEAGETALTPAEMEAFLLTARIVARKGIPTGTTDPVRATLSNGAMTHDAQIQDVDVEKTIFAAGRATELQFKDSYRYNVAGYRLSRLLGLDNVPVSVERRVETKSVAVTWWVDNVTMDERARLSHTPHPVGPDPERTAKQTHIMRVWDELIQNRDRNQGNILWTGDWKLWLIDHTRAFRLRRQLMDPDQLTRCDRALLQRLRGLTAAAVIGSTGRSLTRDEAAAVAARAALIVRHFDDRIAALSEAAVLFTL
jgi:hypothetical protein